MWLSIRKKEAKEVELIGMAYDTEENKSILTKKPKQMNVEELYKYYKMKGHKPAWLWRQLRYKGGEKLIRSFGAEQRWSPGTINKAVRYTKNF